MTKACRRSTLSGFYWHYTSQVWPVLAVLMVVGFFVSLIEVSIFRYVGAIVDHAQDHDARPRARRLRLDRSCGWVSSSSSRGRWSSSCTICSCSSRWRRRSPISCAGRRTATCCARRSASSPDDFAGRIATKIIADRAGAARVRGAGLRRAVVRHHLRDQLAGAVRQPRHPADRAAGDLDRRLRLCARRISCRASASAR